MAELSTIARPYAEALFKASSAGASSSAGLDLEGTAVWLEELAVLKVNYAVPAPVFDTATSPARWRCS